MNRRHQENYKESFNRAIDENGPGVCSGNEDGNNRRQSIDAIISFDILPFAPSDFNDDNGDYKPGDNDHDKLTSYSEYLHYHSDPASSNSDSDVYIDWFESRIGDKADLAKDFTGDTDPDDDGIDLENEQEYFKYGANPFMKDIFVEVDWMKRSDGKEYKFKEGAQNMVIRPFGKHDIALHIDDGCMGGGEAINHTDLLSISEFQDLIDGVYNTNEGFSGRTGFHYCVFADEIWNDRSGSNSGLEYVVADGYSYVNHETKAQAGLFMHETGHSLGLLKGKESQGPGYFPGIDNEDSQNPGDSEYEKYANYKSCMNYRYTKTIINYSDGCHGTNDHDDWGDINLAKYL